MVDSRWGKRNRHRRIRGHHENSSGDETDTSDIVLYYPRPKRLRFDAEMQKSIDKTLEKFSEYLKKKKK